MYELETMRNEKSRPVAKFYNGILTLNRFSYCDVLEIIFCIVMSFCYIFKYPWVKEANFLYSLTLNYFSNHVTLKMMQSKEKM